MTFTPTEGMKTTELWVTLLTDVGVLAAALQGSLSPKYAAVAASVSTLAYALSRGIAKTGSGGTPAK